MNVKKALFRMTLGIAALTAAGALFYPTAAAWPRAARIRTSLRHGLKLRPARLRLAQDGGVFSRIVTPDGAAADGTTDDTQALQRAIDRAAAAGGGTVRLRAGTYLVSKAGDLMTALFSGGALRQAYCLMLKSNVRLDLNGATLKLADGQNASMIVNEHMLHTSPADRNLQVINGILDGNNAHQTVARPGLMAMINFINVSGADFQDLRFDHARDEALNLMAARDCMGDNLECTGSDGDAFGIGGLSMLSSYDLLVHDSAFGTLKSENLRNGIYPAGHGFRQGNPVLACCVNCTFGTIIAKDCGGGFKFESGCDHVVIDLAEFYGAADITTSQASLNSGFKIQGDTPGHDPNDVVVHKVISTGGAGTGLFLEHANNCVIQSYEGSGNSRAGQRPDVWLGAGTGNKIETLNTTNSGGGGILLRAGGQGYKLGTVSVVNPSQAAHAPGVEIHGQGHAIESLTVKDFTGRMGYGVASFDPDTQADIKNLKVKGATQEGSHVQAGAVVVHSNNP